MTYRQREREHSVDSHYSLPIASDSEAELDMDTDGGSDECSGEIDCECPECQVN